MCQRSISREINAECVAAGALGQYKQALAVNEKAV